MGSRVLKLQGWEPIRLQSKSVVNDYGEQNRIDVVALVPPFLLACLSSIVCQVQFHVFIYPFSATAAASTGACLAPGKEA